MRIPHSLTNHKDSRGGKIDGKPMPERKKPRPTSKSRISKNVVGDLAANQIDKLADASATAPEKARRKRRLLEGPEEFRGIRRDSRKR